MGSEDMTEGASERYSTEGRDREDNLRKENDNTTDRQADQRSQREAAEKEVL